MRTSNSNKPVPEGWLKVQSKNPEHTSIFVSYAPAFRSEDVALLGEKLFQNGFNVWLEKPNRSASFGGGEREDPNKSRGVDACDIVIVCYSEAYKKRIASYKEHHYAEKQSKPTVYVLLEPAVEKTGEHWMIIGQQPCYEFFDKNEIDKFIDQIVPVIREKIEALSSFPQFRAPARCEKFQSRPGELSKQLLDKIAIISKTPEFGALLIYGKQDVGKTQLLNDCLSDRSNVDRLKTECKLNAAIWIQCLQWRETQEISNEDFEKRVMAFIKLKHPNATGLGDVPQPDCLLVFDDVYHVEIVKSIVRRCCFKKWPCIAIMRQENFEQAFPADNHTDSRRFKQEAFETPLFSNEEMVKFLIEGLDIRSKNQEISDEDIAAYARSCRGIPRKAVDFMRSNIQSGFAIIQKRRENQAAYLKTVGVPSFQTYYQRSADEEMVRQGLKTVCEDPESGVLLVTGGGGNGKSTLVSQLLRSDSNQQFFVQNCKINCVVWLNCYQWNKDGLTEISQNEERTFYQTLLQLGAKLLPPSEIEVAKSWRKLSDMLTYLKNQRILFVLDDCFNQSLIDALRGECPEMIICILTRFPKRFEGTAIWKSLEIGHLNEAALVDMFQTTHRLKDKLTGEQLMELAKLCHGSPLVADLIAGKLRREATRADNYKEIVEKTSFNHVKIDKITLQRDDERAAFSLFQSAMQLLEEENRLKFLSFLLFDPVEPIRPNDLAVIWALDAGEEAALEILDQFLELSLVRRTTIRKRRYQLESEDFFEEEAAFSVHQIIHEAATLMAYQLYFKDESPNKPPTTSELRIELMCEQPVTKRLLQITKRENVSKSTQLLVFMFKLSEAGLNDILGRSIIRKFQPGDFSHLADETVAHAPNFFSLKFSGQSTVLHLAAKHGDLDLVKIVYEYWSDAVKIQDESGYSPLDVASSLEIAKFLFDKWPLGVVSGNQKQDHTSSPLHEAVDEGRIGLAHLLIERAPEALKRHDSKGRTPLYIACSMNGLDDFVKIMVAKCPDAIAIPFHDNGFTPLHLAASLGYIDKMQTMVEAMPSSLQGRDANGMTPLHVACVNGQLSAAKFLYAKWPAAAQIGDNFGVTPITLAKQSRKCSSLIDLFK